MIKRLLNSVSAKYRDLSVSRRSIICLSLLLWQIVDLLATNKSRYFAQPRPIIVNYLLIWTVETLFNVVRSKTLAWARPFSSLHQKPRGSGGNENGTVAFAGNLLVKAKVKEYFQRCAQWRNAWLVSYFYWWPFKLWPVFSKHALAKSATAAFAGGVSLTGLSIQMGNALDLKLNLVLNILI